MPLDKGLDTKSLRTMLVVRINSLSASVMEETYRNALGFNAAVCWMFRVS